MGGCKDHGCQPQSKDYKGRGNTPDIKIRHLSGEMSMHETKNRIGREMRKLPSLAKGPGAGELKGLL